MTDDLPQSLWEDTSGAFGTENNTRGNSIFGYYADGWFDRRVIEDSPRDFYVAVSPTSVPESTVNPTSADMAFHGNLYFNRSTGASLFMPAAGYYNNIGYPLYLGQRGMYWTSTMNDTANDQGNFTYGYQLQFFHATKSNLVLTGWQRKDACTIRCVAEPRPGTGGGGTPPTGGYIAVENILAVNNLRQLNLDGQKYVNKPGTGITSNYAVMFKYGSLMAIGVDDAGASANFYVSWYPQEYTGTVPSVVKTAWPDVPFIPTGDMPNGGAPDLVAGTGDPCMLASKDNVVTGQWRMPTSMNEFGTTTGSGTYKELTDAVFYSDYIQTVNNTEIHYGTGYLSSYDGQFYPTYHILNSTGSNVSLYSKEDGYYWVNSTEYGGSIEDHDLVQFIKTGGNPKISVGDSYDACAIRCVPNDGAGRRSLPLSSPPVSGGGTALTDPTAPGNN
jgi:hypothetical protein